ncbi:calcium-binding protein [Paraconexibacter algicola]|uniref:Calcium-binding protein n=1 Tax=Paraconexibacter algicola TaxID=2133960 RepID=A0A2T4UG66_9ACTN|nr:calcium-binding protein [Paraconexibacter algicola]PTL58218.1 hypothetical protein C7Y72_00425 [Paraconexibacter algicola]
MLRLIAPAATCAALLAGVPATASAQVTNAQIVFGNLIAQPVATQGHEISITDFGNLYRVRDVLGKVTAFSPCVQNVDLADCPSANVQRIIASGLNAPDNIAIDVLITIPAELSGQGGNDNLTGGSGEDQLFGGNDNDKLFGDAGKDRLTGGPGADQVLGEDGDDTLVDDAGDDTAATPAGDVYTGGPGFDRLDLSARTRPVRVSQNGIADDGRAGEGDNVTEVEWVLGGSADDTIGGTGQADRLVGGGGNDRLEGGGGPDVLLGGTDDGGPVAGDDTLDGGAGPDVFLGGSGTDTVTYETRTTPMTVTIDDVADDGAPGEADNVRAENENVIGGSSTDTITGGDGPNRIEGGDGGDTLSGRGGDDTLLGGPGTDTLTGGTGTDTLLGDAGDDTLESRDGSADTVDCGPGVDTARVDNVDTTVNCESVEVTIVPTPQGTGTTPGVDSAGTGSPAPSTGGPDTTAPSLTALRLSRRTFATGADATAVAAAVRETTQVSWRLSEPAVVTLTVARTRPGIRLRAAATSPCSPRTGRRVATVRRQIARLPAVRRLTGTARTRRAAALLRRRACTVTTTAGTLRRTATAGPSTYTFTGRIGRRALPRGSYRLTAVAQDAAGNRSAPIATTFRIAPYRAR